MWMHCVQYVALSRADLQRWQNVRPHLMQALAKPVRRRFDQVVCVWVGASSGDRPPMVPGVTVIEIGELAELAAAWPRWACWPTSV